jgi:hypothetical protein
MRALVPGGAKGIEALGAGTDSRIVRQRLEMPAKVGGRLLDEGEVGRICTQLFQAPRGHAAVRFSNAATKRDD